MNGSAVAINNEKENVDAIITAGYPGQEGGNAVADVLFGDYNPGGRLPVTYYKSVEQLPAFDNYDMQGRTYRYFEGEPLYPFGYGLSYTTFKYSGLQLAKKAAVGEKVKVSVNVQNTGKLAGDEVVQLYLKDEKASTPRPRHQLEGFKRIHLQPGESQTVEFEIAPRQFSIIGKDDKPVIESGWFTVWVGGGQPGIAGTNTVKGRVELTGKNLAINN